MKLYWYAKEIESKNESKCKTNCMFCHEQNDDTPVSLMEMRFHIPTSEVGGDMDAVEAFHQQVMNKASVISVSGDAIAIFRELQCLTPRYVLLFLVWVQLCALQYT